MSRAIVALHTASFKTSARNQLHLPDALRVLATTIEDVDGFPCSVIGAGPPTSGGNSKQDPEGAVKLTSVESAANRVAGTQHKIDGIHRAIREIDRLESHLEILLIAVLPKIDVPLCNLGTGREGQIEWADPLCTRIADKYRGGMCGTCARNERRWRQEHGHKPREDDAA